MSEGLMALLFLGSLALTVVSSLSLAAAIQRGRTGVGLGVVIGSNIFNIAALLGLSAVVAGKVHIRRRGLIFQGGVVLFVTVVVSALVLRWVAPVVALVVVLLVLVPYVVLSALRPDKSSEPFPWAGPGVSSSLPYPAWKKTSVQGRQPPAPLAMISTRSFPP